ncbi:hypothetical protein [Streptomyces montanisoli]|uniref:Uncharacterized protein n=1 Tax=Streptomyces montanisoli TaxID=2798581 RepID=A0A940RXD7_9ACTN|nr:hypothetical protein [Streptomyces montanisoli]MBP0460465.1 hypothetical protein [Streptomyces montanisoli]
MADHRDPNELAWLTSLDYRALTHPVAKSAVSAYKAAHAMEPRDSPSSDAFGRKQWERRLRLESMAAANKLVYTPSLGVDPLVGSGALTGGFHDRGSCVVDVLTSADHLVTVLSRGTYSRSPSPSDWRKYVAVRLGDESRPELRVESRARPHKKARDAFDRIFEARTGRGWDARELDAHNSHLPSEEPEHLGLPQAIRMVRAVAKESQAAQDAAVFDAELRQVMVENAEGLDVTVAKGVMFVSRPAKNTDELIDPALLRELFARAIPLASALEKATRNPVLRYSPPDGQS